jgi:hypothetical protein
LLKGELAKKTGLAPATIGKLELGTYDGLRFETIVTLAGFFEVGLDYMAGIDHAQVVRAAAVVGRQCPECGRIESHTVPECALAMWELGRPHAFIAARFGMTLPTVLFMLREEMELARGGAVRGERAPDRTMRKG